MAPFSVTQQSPLTAQQAWARVTDWPTHARWVPLTRISVTTAGPNGVGTIFNARTGTDRVGFDDPMEVVEWQPPDGDVPGRCRLEKRGSVMLGWAELSVEPTPAGSRTTWTEEAKPAGLPAFTDAGSRLAGRLLFGRVLRKLLAASP